MVVLPGAQWSAHFSRLQSPESAAVVWEPVELTWHNDVTIIVIFLPNQFGFPQSEQKCLALERINMEVGTRIPYSKKKRGCEGNLAATSVTHCSPGLILLIWLARWVSSFSLAIQVCLSQSCRLSGRGQTSLNRDGLVLFEGIWVAVLPC